MSKKKNGHLAPRLALAAFSFLACLVIGSQAQADEDAFDPAKWAGWWEFGGTLGTDNASRGEIALFAPLFQSETSLLFADVRGKLFDADAQEGNFALGYRAMHDQGFIYGVWGGLDLRDSTNGTLFPQLSGGVEALWEGFDVRANGYLPLKDDELLASSTAVALTGATTVALQGTNIVTTGPGTATTAALRELALYGFDAEAGARLWDDGIAELRVYGGGFWFDHEDLPGSVAGPRARAEFRINDVIPFFPGSRLTFEGEFSWDEVRHDKWEAGARLRIPFGGTSVAGGSRYASLTPLEQRMTEAIERDTDIVTNTQSSTTQAATTVDTPLADDASGEALNVYHVANTAQGAGTCASVADACTSATALGLAGIGDILIPVDVDGPIASGFTLTAARQQVVGGGDTGSADLTLSDTAGSSLTVPGLGGRATVQGTVAMSQSNRISGFDISNSGGAGLLAGGAVGATGNTVSDTTISGSTAGIRFAAASSGMVSFANDVMVQGQAGGPAFEVLGGSAGATFNGTVNQGADAFVVSVSGGHTGTLDFTASSNVTATDGTGMKFLNADGTYTFQHITLTGAGTSAAASIYVEDSGGTFTFRDTTIADLLNPGVVVWNQDSSRTTIVTMTATVTTGRDSAVGLYAFDGGKIIARIDDSSLMNGLIDGISGLASGGGRLDLTAVNNTVTNTGLGRGGVHFETYAGSTTCLDATDNTVSGWQGDFEFYVAGGTSQITQDSLGGLSTENNGSGTSVLTGSVTFGQPCTVPVN